MRILLSFLITLIPFSVFAQDLEFNVVRTSHSPGFFAVKLYPGSHLVPLDIHDVYVKNYDDNKAMIYQELILMLNELGTNVIEENEVAEYLSDPYTRLIFLGNEKEGYLNFKAIDANLLMEDFENFSTENLGSIFLQDIQIDFGGNISDVYYENLEFLGNGPVLAIGKFARPMRTRMVVSGVSNKGELNATAIADLRTYTEDPLVQLLPDMWEELANPPVPKSDKPSWWFAIFPWGLGLIGILIVSFSLLSFIKKILEKSTELPTEIHISTNKNPCVSSVQTLTNNSSHKNSIKADIESKLPFEVERRNDEM